MMGPPNHGLFAWFSKGQFGCWMTHFAMPIPCLQVVVGGIPSCRSPALGNPKTKKAPLAQGFPKEETFFS